MLITGPATTGSVLPSGEVVYEEQNGTKTVSMRIVLKGQYRAGFVEKWNEISQ